MIICCGFVNSGTRLLYKIVTQDLGLRAVHRSYPHWQKLWRWEDYEGGTGSTERFTWVAISRVPEAAIPAAVSAGHPGVRKNIRRDPPASVEEVTDWYNRWLEMSRSMPAYWISYENLVSDPPGTIGALAQYLGVTGTYSVRQIRDENAKWLDPAPS